MIYDLVLVGASDAFPWLNFKKRRTIWPKELATKGTKGPHEKYSRLEINLPDSACVYHPIFKLKGMRFHRPDRTRDLILILVAGISELDA